ncbi:MAG: type II toxin-antitoxin system RelE/ParE family toxin [Bacteroidota bacterium]|nr:type II toxin-antitoxin system RelE/ParE family toxin [Bacteroidota bacterium]
MSYNIVASGAFAKEIKQLAKKYPSIGNDIRELSNKLKLNPFEGTPLGKDCYKIRIAIKSKGKGKSGGARVITCVKIVANVVFLLSIYDKSNKEDISDKELDLLLKMSGILI